MIFSRAFVCVRLKVVWLVIFAVLFVSIQFSSVAWILVDMKANSWRIQYNIQLVDYLIVHLDHEINIVWDELIILKALGQAIFFAVTFSTYTIGVVTKMYLISIKEFLNWLESKKPTPVWVSLLWVQQK